MIDLILLAHASKLLGNPRFRKYSSLSEMTFQVCHLCRLKGISVVLPLSLCSCFLLFAPGNMLCIADVLLEFIHTLYTFSSSYHKSQRGRVFLLSKKYEFRLNYFPSSPTANSHLISGFFCFPCLF